MVVAIYGESVVQIVEAFCFERRSTVLPKSALPTIEAVAETFTRHRMRVQVRGNASADEGSSAEWLIRKRIDAVIAALVSAGVAKDDLLAADARKELERNASEKSDDRCVRLRVLEFEGESQEE